MKTRIGAALAAAALAAGGALAAAGPASAHTPSVTATCEGVTVTGTNYETKDTNTLSVSVDGGDAVTKDFGVNGSLTAPVPVDFAVHTYAARVETTNSNPAFTKEFTGKVGPCDKNPFIETSNVAVCGQVAITLHNHSPWIYPVSYRVDGGDWKYGPVVDNRGEAPDDQSATKTFTFEEDSGDHTVEYLVNAGTESDLYTGKPVGEVTTVTVKTDCEVNLVTLNQPKKKDLCGYENDHYGLPSSEGVKYGRDGLDITAEVTAENAVLPQELPDGWARVDDTHAVFAFDKEDFTSEPCAEEPAPQVETRPGEGEPNCTDGIVPTWVEERRTDVVYDPETGTYTESGFTDWAVIEDSRGARPATSEECPTATPTPTPTPSTTPSVTPTPTPTPVATIVPATTTERLAQTGAGDWMLPGVLVGLALLVAGGVAVAASRSRA